MALTDATAIAAREIIKGNGVDPAAVNFLILEDGELSHGFDVHNSPRPCCLRLSLRRPRCEGLADWPRRRITPRSAASDSWLLRMLSRKIQPRDSRVIRAVLQTMVYMRDPKNHRELVDYVLKIHKIDAAVAAEALATVMAVYSKDGTKSREAVQSEIDIYREALKITKPFTPEELEDMSHQKRAYEFLNASLAQRLADSLVTG